jgi:SAM-dependent methyltransferase
MCPNRSVDYGVVWDDYAYFLAHSTETSVQVTALEPHLARLAGLGAPRRLLDFGCGDGAFLARLAATLGISPHHVEPCIVEPRKALRERAAQRLFEHGFRVEVRAGLDEVSGRFDLILANHSLYYVSDISLVTRQLVELLSPGGRLVVAMLDRKNALAQVWLAGFRGDASGFPFMLAEDFEIALHRLGFVWRREMVRYRIDFPDTESARGHVLRFLFGDHVDSMPQGHSCSLCDSFRADGRIVMPTEYPHLIVEKPGR